VVSLGFDLKALIAAKKLALDHVYIERSEQRWHCDETRWAVFTEIEGKVGHRW